MKYIYSCLSLLLACNLYSQAQTPLLKVFLGPEGFDFFRSEVNFVDYVSDRSMSDVQFQSVAEYVDNGATRFKYLFLGYGRFEGQNDTIIWHTDPGENQGSIREKSILAYKQGLLTYLLQTPAAGYISYEVNPVLDYANTPDPWRKWTFRPSLDFNGQQAFFSDSNPLNGDVKNSNGAVQVKPSFTFWHISETWRVVGSIHYRYFHNWRHTTSGLSEFSKKEVSLGANLNAAYSISSHWSVGMGFFRSQYWNSQNAASFFPNKPFNNLSLGVEHSFLPYRDYFRKRFVLGYTWGANLTDGEHLKTPDIFLRNHQFYAEYAKIARWGYVIVGAGNFLNYIPNQWTRFSLNSNFRFAINLGKNIYTTLTLHGTWGNEFNNLAGLNGTPIVESKRIRSGNYDCAIGIDYYFGSGYRNVVNPRFYASGQYF